jgi:hypothetical protein
MVRGLTSRKGFFAQFRNIIVGIIVLGILLYWQAILDANILFEIEEAGFDTSEISFSFANMAFIVYFLGLAAIGFVFFRNRQDVKNWFPAKK